MRLCPALIEPTTGARNRKSSPPPYLQLFSKIGEGFSGSKAKYGKQPIILFIAFMNKRKD